MIDEKIKTEILANLPKVLARWSEEKFFDEPRSRWFKMEKLRHDPEKVHYLIALIVGKDEKETWQMANELKEWHKKYTADQSDVIRKEDYTERKY